MALRQCRRDPPWHSACCVPPALFVSKDQKTMVQSRGFIGRRAQSFQALHGRGVQATVPAKQLLLGGPALLRQTGVQIDSVLELTIGRASRRGQAAITMLDGSKPIRWLIEHALAFHHREILISQLPLRAHSASRYHDSIVRRGASRTGCTACHRCLQHLKLESAAILRVPLRRTADVQHCVRLRLTGRAPADERQAAGCTVSIELAARG
jgi:hypothetical protein